MPITFSKVLSMYALLQASFQSFKALHRAQQYSTLIDEHNRARKKDPTLDPIDDSAIFRVLDQKEIVPLLHFWSVMAVIHLYDSYIEFAMEWIPFYSAFKFVLMVWLLFPRTKGATVFFESVLIPQTHKHMARMEEKWFPLARRLILDFVFLLFRAGLNGNLETVSYGELNELNRTVDLLTRSVTREGYRRNRDESMLTLKQALPDDKQRVALLDDILKEYTLQSDPTGNWTEVLLERENQGGIRVRFYSDMDSDEEQDWRERMFVQQ
ncbi:hypothetical protein BASA82_001070 [Batrachochytrium salamandrivorans]|nr:hypothetical protein BASA82_001070 [Batrachochytrium salamandrivorans]